MNTTYHSSFPPFSIDLNQDFYDNQSFFSTSQHVEQVAPSSPSSFPNYPFFLNPSPQQVPYCQRELQPIHHQQEANVYVSDEREGSLCDHHQGLKNKKDDISLQLSVCRKERNIGNQSEDNNNTSVKWMSSKMRFMKKMMGSDQTVVAATPAEASAQKFEEDEKEVISSSSSPTLQVDNNSSSGSSNNTIRVCSDCNTTKTPLWRSGPRGPKSLCNACGIRQRKARRAMAAAAAATGAANGTIFAADDLTKPVKTSTSNNVQKRDKKTSNSNNNNNINSHLPFKKRCKFTSAQAARARKNVSKLGFEDLTVILSKKYSAFQRVFPQDEKDAAILLMALSYGLVHG